MSYYQYKTTKLYYEIYGEGQPVLLIHGWSLDHNCFIGCMDPIFKESSQAYQRYYIDLPGMGKSEPGFVRNGDDIVEVLSAFIQVVIRERQQTNKSEQVLLVGNSFGGMLACGIAHQHPELIKGMILIAGATDCATRKLPPRKTYKEDKEFLASLSKEEYEDFYEMHMNLTKEAWNHYKTYIYPAVRANKTNDYLNHVLYGSLSYDLYEKNPDKQFQKPVLFVTGKQDTSVGYEDPFELSRCYPASTYTAIHGAGHNVWIDQPEAFHDIVSSWMKYHYMN
ncbi:MAG: alpha/beta hydrolase [Clostridiales bacterium]|nr:alpha/beta hydrolase [Clostridiales bacterium]